MYQHWSVNCQQRCWAIQQLCFPNSSNAISDLIFGVSCDLFQFVDLLRILLIAIRRFLCLTDIKEYINNRRDKDLPACLSSFCLFHSRSTNSRKTICLITTCPTMNSNCESSKASRYLSPLIIRCSLTWLRWVQHRDIMSPGLSAASASTVSPVIRLFIGAVLG